MKILSTERTVVLAPARLVAILSGGNIQIRSAQKLAWDNKVVKGASRRRWSSVARRHRAASGSVPGFRVADKAMLIVDTGPLVAYLNRNDADHARCAALLESRTDDLLVTPYVVTEACYLVGKHVSAAAEINLVEALVAGDLLP
jgi:hypothetical protein